jgi:drug/metabolite transporter (DMT)-like permease
VRAVSKARTLQAGAIAWGLAIAVQKRCVQLCGKVPYPWWVVGIVVSLLQWAFYVNQKAALIANPRDVYAKPEARS